MILSVGHVQGVAVQDHALWVAERGLAEAAVDKPLLPGPGDLQDLTVLGGDDDPVVIGVCNEKSAGGPVGQDLSRKRKGPITLFLALQLELQWPSVYQAPLVELPDHLGKHLVEGFQSDFSLVLSDDLSLGVYEHQRGPGPHPILLPHLEVPVVNDRVLDFVAQYGLADVVSVLFDGELGGVYSDHDQLGGVFLFQFPQLRKYVHAVDSAVGPEVQDHDLSPQVLQA